MAGWPAFDDHGNPLDQQGVIDRRDAFLRLRTRPAVAAGDIMLLATAVLAIGTWCPCRREYWPRVTTHRSVQVVRSLTEFLIIAVVVTSPQGQGPRPFCGSQLATADGLRRRDRRQ